MSGGSKFTLLHWFRTDLGKWWIKQMDRVNRIIELDQDAQQVRIAQKHRAALNTYLDEVEQALAVLRKNRGKVSAS